MLVQKTSRKPQKASDTYWEGVPPEDRPICRYDGLWDYWSITGQVARTLLNAGMYEAEREWRKREAAPLTNEQRIEIAKEYVTWQPK